MHGPRTPHADWLSLPRRCAQPPKLHPAGLANRPAQQQRRQQPQLRGLLLHHSQKKQMVLAFTTICCMEPINAMMEQTKQKASTVYSQVRYRCVGLYRRIHMRIG